MYWLAFGAGSNFRSIKKVVEKKTNAQPGQVKGLFSQLMTGE